MGKKLLQRAAALTAAVAMTCGGFGNAALDGLAASLPRERTAAREERQDRSKPVSVIISLNSDAVMAGENDAAYLETQDAAAKSDAVLRRQNAVIAQIREWYPELEVRYRYTTLVNGFSCSVPAGLIGKIRELPEVQDITLTGKMKVKEEMAGAPELSGIPAYYAKTGCTGEGKVIAVIDSEIDVTHPMFAPLAENLQKKIDKSDLDAIASGVGFNTHFSTDTAYINSKVPFAIDYTEEPNEIASPTQYHGTHVCGIAAGNRITNADGVAMSGVAPDAQIVFMGMENAMWDIDEVLIAAIEDAVKLNVDAINMSLGIDGDPMGQNVLAAAVNQAEAAGITVCIAAGNSDNGESEYGETHYADNPDVSWMNSFIDENTRALAVASADNATTMYYPTICHDGMQMAYEGCADSIFNEMRYLGQELGTEQEFEYVYCGLGYPEDFNGKDLTGKLALVDRGDIYFEHKANNAKLANAIGVIVIQTTDEGPLIMSSDSQLALAMVSKEDGEILRNAENKTVRFSDELTAFQKETDVSSYTSWGIHSSLDLRPDIMGIGGNVESAGYNNATERMSGTSMATPYMAGCSMILKEYLEENGCTLTGSDLAKYMRNLMMTTAEPYIKDNMYITPRRQGAGLVRMDRAADTKVLLTGTDGESKLSLRDKLGTQFTFPLTLTNISNEDVSYTSARIELTTDAAEYDASKAAYVIKGQQPLNCTASFGNAAQIAAGETKTENITVTLDADQAAAIKEVFTSGFFIEGYLLLEGAENSADISIPLVGFSDNFAQIPAFGRNIQSLALVNGYHGANVSIPLSDYVNTALGVLERLKARYGYDLAIDMQDDPDTMFIEVLDNTTDEEYLKLTQGGDALYCSPNQDGIADLVGLSTNMRRHCYISGMEVLDSDGRVVAAGFPEKGVIKDEYYPEILGTSVTLDDLKDGTYTAQIYSTISTNPAEEDRQIVKRPLYIDRKAPTLSTQETETNGKKIVEVTASDNCALDGVIVFGKGNGHIAGQSRPGSTLNGMTPLQVGMSVTLNYQYYFEQNPYYDGQAQIDFDALEVMHPFMQRLSEAEVEDTDSYFSSFDYVEFIPASAFEDGVVSVDYDVTDLSLYEFIAMDRAFNIGYPDDKNTLMRPNEIKEGVYQSKNGLYIFTEDTLHFIPAMNSYETTYHYTLEDGIITLIGDMDDSNEQGEYRIRINADANGGLCIKGYLDYLLGFDYLENFYGDTYGDDLVPVDISDPEHYYAIHGYDAEARYIKPYVLASKSGIRTGQTDYRLFLDGIVEYDINCFENNRYIDTVTIRMDLKTGIAKLPDGTMYNFLEDKPGKRGDVDCSDTVDVSDAVLLARMLAEDKEVYITAKGLANADCDQNGERTQYDVVLILRAIARLITLD